MQSVNLVFILFILCAWGKICKISSFQDSAKRSKGNKQNTQRKCHLIRAKTAEENKQSSGAISRCTKKKHLTAFMVKLYSVYASFFPCEYKLFLPLLCKRMSGWITLFFVPFLALSPVGQRLQRVNQEGKVLFVYYLKHMRPLQLKANSPKKCY